MVKLACKIENITKKNKVKNKIKIRSNLPRLVTEHCLELPYQRGEYMVEEGEDPQDETRKTTRLRRKCVYDEMVSRGSITIEQRDCAEKYAILCEKALGRTGDLFARINLLRESRSNWEPSQAQHEAYDRLFKLWRAMGKYHTSILNMIVLGNMGTKQISQVTKMNLHYTMGQVLSTFILLEEAVEEAYA